MSDQYDAGQIQVLEGLEPVRKRPGMYIGSTSVEGLHHLVYEVVDNSIDEALAGYCDEIFVNIEEDGSILVKDNGRGIPVGTHKTEKISALEVVMTKLHAGGKFEKGAYKVSGGLHGVGISVVNALSAVCRAEVHQAGKIYRQTFKRGIPDAPVATVGTTTTTGTIIHFYPDEDIFAIRIFSFDILVSRLRELAFLNRGIRIHLVDKRLEHPQQKKFYFEGGLKEFIKDLNKGKTVLNQEPIYFEKERDGVIVEFAAQYNESYSETILTFANNINTKEGGTHLSGFKGALTRAINDLAKNDPKISKKIEEPITGEDAREGLTSILSVKIPEPQFEGQTKSKLGNSEVRGIVESLVYEQLNYYFELNPQQVGPILEKALLAVRARASAKRAREQTRRKSFLENTSLPGKLADCSSKNPASTEIYIVEGDSAGGSAKMGRDREFQAILPLWGKMLNSERTRFDKVLANEKLIPIITALGTGAGPDFDLSRLRYHKVIIMADADVDGSHIRCLLLTFFFRYMQDLIKEGHVYFAMPPLYKITKGSVIRYAYDDKDKNIAVAEMDPTGNGKVDISRYKGLGEMNPEQLWETTMDPESRMLSQVTMEDLIGADQIFSILMGEEVPPRRQFIEENALSVANLDV